MNTSCNINCREKYTILHFHISHNAPYFPGPPTLNKHCFQFLLGQDSPMQVTGFTNTGPLVFGSGRDDPPALVPRVRRPSNGSLSENRSDFPSMPPISGQEKPLYSNMTPISETSEDFITENNEDDTDADGYMKCVRSRDGPSS